MAQKSLTKLNVMIHGGDYNPDQWLDYPEVLKKDIELMKEAKINAVTLAVFAWATLEPEEGVYNFTWLDEVIDNLYNNGIYTILATPSGARPRWMAEKYPEVLRVDDRGQRQLFARRHNHCFTSPVYREKVRQMNQKLASRYGNHPGIILWHIGNEFSGECHCDLCQTAFRKWLKNKYVTIDKLNHEWWNPFWSHTLNNFDQAHSPSSIGEMAIMGLTLDWKRFVTDQTIDFYLHEVQAVKEITDKIPFTTNLMGLYDGLDYQKLVEHLDIVSYDNYPQWHLSNEVEKAGNVGFIFDMYRSFKNKPFMMMETDPSTTNWQQVSKLRKPGMHKLSSIQALAHGSDSVQYFQIHRSRGGYEKFAGSVIDLELSNEHRVFKDVKEVGYALEKLTDIVGTKVNAKVGIVYDWQNKWAIEGSCGPRNAGMRYAETVESYYKTFWRRNVPVDVIGKTHDFSKYRLLIVPMLYMLTADTSKKLADYVENGGTLVTTYFTGYVNENDLFHLGGFPEINLRKALGIKVDEIDPLKNDEANQIEINTDKLTLPVNSYECKDICELISLEGAQVLAKYERDFYAGYPALTVHNYGNGKAYYVATRTSINFNDDFLGKLCEELKIKSVIPHPTPRGVNVTYRTDGKFDYVFIMNFGQNEEMIELDENEYINMLTDEKAPKTLKLGRFDVVVLKRKAAMEE